MTDRLTRAGDERVLEAGFVLLAAVSLGAGLTLLYDRLAGGARRGRRRAEGPPEPGSVPASRHAHIDTVAPR